MSGMSKPRGRCAAVCVLSLWFVVGCDGGSGGTGGTAGATGAAGTHGAAGSQASTGAAGTHGAAGSQASTGAAGTHGAAGTSGGADPYAAARQACVDKINTLRATLSLAELGRWTAQETCVDGQAKADSVAAKAHSAFGTCGEFAQDECPGWMSVASITNVGGCLDKMWAEGPGTDYATHGHFINMSNKKYTQVACGYYTTPTGDMWAAQNFK
jgi:hypothetical protein